MICIIIGVSGSGKSTIGTLLSQRTLWQFYDGDDFHPPENIEKMSRGIPLDDADRKPWLLGLRDLIDEVLRKHNHGIIACSALKQVYREVLEENHQQDILWIYLQGDYEEILNRIEQREGHFMKAEMLRSQFEAWEDPLNGFAVSIANSPEAIVDKIVEYISIATMNDE